MWKKDGGETIWRKLWRKDCEQGDSEEEEEEEEEEGDSTVIWGDLKYGFRSIFQAASIAISFLTF